MIAHPFLTAAMLAPIIAQARDLVVYGEPTLQPALRSIGTLWRSRSSTRVNIFVTPTDLSYAQIERGARCDVIFALAGADTEAAARNKIIDADTVSRVLRNSLALVGPAPDSAPKANLTPANLSQLIAGKRLAIANPDRDPAGTHAVDFLRRAGMTVNDANETIVVAESSAGVVNMLVTGKAHLGIVYASDAVAGFHFPVTKSLPTPDRSPIEYVVAQARDPALDTKSFLALLKSPEGEAIFKSAGLIPLNQ